MIELITGEAKVTPETGNDILLDSDRKNWMRYVVSYTEPDVRDGIRGNMDVTLTESNTLVFVFLGLPDESGGMVGSQDVVGIPKYNMIVKYDLMGYADQAALPNKLQTLMDASVETVYGYIVLKFKKLLVEEGGNDIVIDGTQNFIYAFSDTVSDGNGSNRGNSVIDISSGGSSKVSDYNQGKCLAHGILKGLA